MNKETTIDPITAPDKFANLNKLASIPYDGAIRKKNLINQVISWKGIKEYRADDGRVKLYNIEEVKEAMEEWLSDHQPIPQPKSEKYAKLKETKLLKEIEMLKANITKADTSTRISEIELENLKRRSIEASEVRDYLLLRYGVENAIIRQILYVNAPVDLVGLSIPQARDKCEEYYHMIQDAMHDTLLLWQNKVIGGDSSNDIPEKIQKVIDILTSKLNKVNADTDNQRNE